LALGTGIINGIKDGVTGAVGSLASAAAQAARDALQAAKDALGIRSPSVKAMREVGLPLMQGVAKGISKNAGLPAKALGRAANASLGAAFGGGGHMPAMAGAGASGGGAVIINVNGNLVGNRQQAIEFANLIDRERRVRRIRRVR